MRTRIKICGVRDIATARAAGEAGADAVGLMFAAGSPRQVGLAEAQQVLRALPAMVEPVGVFMDESPEQVQAAADLLRLRTVQLHGQETPEQVARMPNLRVIKALSFESETQVRESVGQWHQAGTHLVGLLFDAPPPGEGELPGGSGHRFDWAALARLRDEGVLAGLPPICLAGGLTPENVGEAIRAVRPAMVDVSSGVESSRGVKDIGLIRRFCEAVHEADAEAGPERVPGVGE